MLPEVSDTAVTKRSVDYHVDYRKEIDHRDPNGRADNNDVLV